MIHRALRPALRRFGIDQVGEPRLDSLNAKRKVAGPQIAASSVHTITMRNNVLFFSLQKKIRERECLRTATHLCAAVSFIHCYLVVVVIVIGIEVLSLSLSSF